MGFFQCCWNVASPFYLGNFFLLCHCCYYCYVWHFTITCPFCWLVSICFIMGVDKFLKVGGGGANNVFLLEITSIAHFSHPHQSFDG